jgi:6-pyruvoyl-tetrahydropterin synthase
VFQARVERTISAAHHNGPKDSKCHLNHGHDWGVKVQFKYFYPELNQYGWGPDFGLVKKVLDRYDHQDLNLMMVGIPPSAENFAVELYDTLYKETAWQPEWVEVDEGNGNSVRYTPSK